MSAADKVDLIIYRPERLSASKKWADAGMTLIFWGLLFYMWQPFLSLLAWAFKIKLFYDHMIILGGYQAFSELVLVYSVVVILLGGTLLLWARINQFRFRGKENRKQVAQVNTEEEAEKFQVDYQELVKWKNYKNCRVHLNDQGLIKSIART